MPDLAKVVGIYILTFTTCEPVTWKNTDLGHGERDRGSMIDSSDSVHRMVHFF